MKLSDFVLRADQLIEKADRVLSTTARSDYRTYVDEEAFSAFRVAGLSFLKSVFGPDHPYYAEFYTKVSDGDPHDTKCGKGILAAAREEIAGGWMETARGIVSAEVFSDFLEMASHLLSENYKDPAVVIIGGVLEEHLRQLCRKHDIEVESVVNGKHVPKKADALNAELARAGVFGKLEQKMVTAWLDLRNKAAHGHYVHYTETQVQLMHQGVLDFTTRIAL